MGASRRRSATFMRLGASHAEAIPLKWAEVIASPSESSERSISRHRSSWVSKWYRSFCRWVQQTGDRRRIAQRHSSLRTCQRRVGRCRRLVHASPQPVNLSNTTRLTELTPVLTKHSLGTSAPVLILNGSSSASYPTAPPFPDDDEYERESRGVHPNHDGCEEGFHRVRSSQQGEGSCEGHNTSVAASIIEKTSLVTAMSCVSDINPAYHPNEGALYDGEEDRSSFCSIACWSGVAQSHDFASVNGDTPSQLRDSHTPLRAEPNENVSAGLCLARLMRRRTKSLSQQSSNTTISCASNSKDRVIHGDAHSNSKDRVIHGDAHSTKLQSSCCSHISTEDPAIVCHCDKRVSGGNVAQTVQFHPHERLCPTDAALKQFAAKSEGMAASTWRFPVLGGEQSMARQQFFKEGTKLRPRNASSGSLRESLRRRILQPIHFSRDITKIRSCTFEKEQSGQPINKVRWAQRLHDKLHFRRRNNCLNVTLAYMDDAASYNIGQNPYAVTYSLEPVRLPSS